MTFDLAQKVMSLEMSREGRNVYRTILAARELRLADECRIALGIPSVRAPEKK